VKGILFADYVRMVRSHKGVDWSHELAPEDLPFLSTKIDPAGWYPMASFERLGNAIMKFVANKDLRAVHMWGRFSADQLRAVHPMRVADGDAVETMNRFRVMRATFFDFEALDIPMLTDEQAHVHINYYMGPEAEEAACMQTLGFFERQLELAGAKEVGSRWLSRSYAGNAETILELIWTM